MSEKTDQEKIDELQAKIDELKRLGNVAIDNSVREKIEDDLKEAKNDIKNIKENHLTHIQKSMSNIETNAAIVGNDVSWLKKFFWIVASASIGSLAAGLINLLISVKQ